MKSLIITLFFPLCCFSQQHKPLSIGDNLPTQLLTSLTGNQQPVTGNPLLILDFWATWCTSCLSHFSEMQSFQKQFDGRLQILLVNAKDSRDDEKKIKNFFEKHRNTDGKKFELPYILLDTVFTKLFPHKLLPHYVWINAGKVVAITGSEYVTAENINACINGMALKLPVKKDINDYDPAQPILLNENGGDESSLLFRSSFTKYLDGLNTSVKATKDSLSKKFICINHPILSLYWQVLKFPSNRIVLEVKDSSRYLQSLANNKFWKNNLYSYEITVPLAETTQEINNIILQDLDLYLGLHGRMEQRMVNCWSVVRKDSGNDLMKTKGGKAFIQLYSNEHPITILCNQSLSKFISACNHQSVGDFPFRPIVVDETGITYNIDIELRSSLTDLQSLKTELNKYGLDLITTIRKLDVFVLNEKQLYHP